MPGTNRSRGIVFGLPALAGCVVLLLAPSEAHLSSHPHVAVRSVHATLSVSKGFPKTSDGSDLEAARAFEHRGEQALARFSDALEAAVPDLAKRGITLQAINRKASRVTSQGQVAPNPGAEWERIPGVTTRTVSFEAVKALGVPRLADSLDVEVGVATSPPPGDAGLRRALLAVMDPRNELFKP